MMLLLSLACRPPPQAPSDIDSLLQRLFADFESEAALSDELEALSELGAEEDYTLSALEADAVSGITHPDRNLGALLGVVGTSSSSHSPAAHAEHLLLTDATALFPNTIQYTRAVTEGADCFAEQSCDVLRTLCQLHIDTLFASLDFEFRKDFRWVGDSILARGWIEASAEGESGQLWQSFEVEVWSAAGGGTEQLLAVWVENSQSDSHPDLVSTMMSASFQDIFTAHNQWLEGGLP